MAFELASKGLKILLISRSEERLAETLTELSSLHPTGKGSATLAVDMSSLGSADAAAMSKVKAALKGKNIAVLVNNVGISYDHPEYFDQLSDDAVNKLISLNVGATTWMTRLVLPGMLEKDNKNSKGAIVSIASSSATFACPLLSQYSAAKEYVIRLSQSLGAEYENKGVHFQVQTAHFVTSKLSKVNIFCYLSKSS